jgi:4-diphosphocytidyl-2-C-methyl-D-erythritol kinase
MHNDLQEPALTLRPRLRDVLDAGVAAGALGGIVSGSGPTVAFLVADPVAAARVNTALSGLEQVRAAFSTTGPAPGARVIGRSD